MPKHVRRHTIGAHQQNITIRLAAGRRHRRDIWNSSDDENCGDQILSVMFQLAPHDNSRTPLQRPFESGVSRRGDINQFPARNCLPYGKIVSAGKPSVQKN